MTEHLEQPCQEEDNQDTQRQTGPHFTYLSRFICHKDNICLGVLPSQLMQCLFALFCLASPAPIDRWWYWVCRLQLNSKPWVVGQVTEHRPKLRHSPLIKAEREMLSVSAFHIQSVSLFSCVPRGGKVNRKWVNDSF